MSNGLASTLGGFVRVLSHSLAVQKQYVTAGGSDCDELTLGSLFLPAMYKGKPCLVCSILTALYALHSSSVVDC